MCQLRLRNGEDFGWRKLPNSDSSASSFQVIILVGFVFYFRRLYAEIKLWRNEMIQGGYVYGFYALLTFALVNHSKLHKTYSIVTWYVSCAHSHSFVSRHIYLWLCCQKSLLISPSPPPLLVTAASFYREQFFIVLPTDLFMSHLYFLVSCLCPSAIFIATTILFQSSERKVSER